MKWCIFLILLLGGLVFDALFTSKSFQNPFKVPIVRKTKLIDITNAHSVANFNPPQGVRYTFVVALPPGSANPRSPDGKITFYDQSNEVMALLVQSNTIVNCDWLNNLSLCGYIVQRSPDDANWNLRSY